MNKTIETKAPMFAHKEIFIEGPINRVWNLQTNIEDWPQWQPDISNSQLEGPLAAGSVFRWKAKGMKIISTLHTVVPMEKFGWTGTSPGMYAIHNWTFKTEGSGTWVRTEESLSGWLTRVLKLFDPKFLEKSLEASLLSLKTQVENLN